jgi:hypothetical protein
MNDAELLTMAADVNCDCITGMPIVHAYDEGFFVYVHDADFIDEAKRGYIDVGLSKEFVRLIDVARSFDCTYLHLDADGTDYDDLKKFDW